MTRVKDKTLFTNVACCVFLYLVLRLLLKPIKRRKVCDHPVGYVGFSLGSSITPNNRITDVHRSMPTRKILSLIVKQKPAELVSNTWL